MTPPRPITPARRNSNSSDELAVVQAGKALKKAILHDARNMTGKADEEGVGVLGWTVGSTQEAKVIIHLTIRWRFTQCEWELNLSFSFLLKIETSTIDICGLQNRQAPKVPCR